MSFSSEEGSTLVGELKDLQSDINRVMNKINMNNIHSDGNKNSISKTSTRQKSLRWYYMMILIVLYFSYFDEMYLKYCV